MISKPALSFEDTLEERFRKNSFFIPFITFLTAFLLIAALYGCMMLFISGHYWIILVSGVLYHSLMIVAVHDGAHKGITKTSADSWIMAIFAGIILLPFYPEPFRRYHLIHHANTNAEVDPLWPGLKKKIFEKSRVLYVLAELVPFGFLMVSVFTKKESKEYVAGPRIRPGFMILSFLVSFAVIWFMRPDPWFVLFSALAGTVVAKFRHWCEHLGEYENKESNTYWFPLGMGIGNHEVHHDHPHYSWFTLMIGLWRRKKDTHPLKAFSRILTDKGYRHYPEKSN